MKKIVPHLSLALSLMVLTFFVIDRINEIMGFMTSELSKWVIGGLALTSCVTSICLIAENIRSDARKARKARKKERARARKAVPAPGISAPEEPDDGEL